MRVFLTLLVMLPALALTVMAAEPTDVPPRIIRLPTPADAQNSALTNLKEAVVKGELSSSDLPFQRFIWAQDQYYESKQLVSLTVNYISRASVIYRPALVKGGLVRIDLRRIAPKAEDLAEYLTLWEEFSFDPSFATIITKDAIEQEIKRGTVFADVLGVGAKKLLVRCKPYMLDGVEQDSKWVAAIRLTGRHLDLKTASELELLTGSLAPVTEHRYFTFRALSTIKDKGVYADVFGGVYYELASIKKSKVKGITDEDLLFDSVGVGDSAKGVNADVIYERVRSDRKVATFNSGVTGKPRWTDILNILSGNEQATMLVTHDPADGDIDIGQHAMMNLLHLIRADGKAPTEKARETIFTKPNGLHGFVLFDGDGKLADEAPPDVVVDHRIPAPYTNRLAGPISCIRCHGDSDGIKPLKNDVLALRQGYLDIFGDVGKDGIDKTIPDVLDRLAGQFAGSPDTKLRRAREDYLNAILKATGPWKEDKEAQTGVGRITSNAYTAMWQDYWYDSIDAHKALAEIGHQVPQKEAVAIFRTIVPPDESNRIGGIIPEDIRIGGLGLGLKISRADWSLVYSFAATRARQNEAKLAKGKK